MPEDDDLDLRDIRAEETTRGRKQPRRAISLARQRMIRRVAQMLASPHCDEDTFLGAIREFGLPEDSEEFRQLLALWKKRHGRG